MWPRSRFRKPSRNGSSSGSCPGSGPQRPSRLLLRDTVPASARPKRLGPSPPAAANLSAHSPRLTDDMDVPGYDVVEEIARHGPYAVYRGRRQRDEQPVLLKAPLRAPLLGADSEGLRREFELLRHLSVPGIASAYDVIRTADTTCLVLEDCGLVPLRERLGAGRLDLPSFFRIAVRLSTILGELHPRKVIHRGISP